MPLTFTARFWPVCYNNVTWAPYKWPVKRKMFPFDDVIMAQHYCIFVRGTIGDRWIPVTKGQWCGKCCPVMASAWDSFGTDCAFSFLWLFIAVRIGKAGCRCWGYRDGTLSFLPCHCKSFKDMVPVVEIYGHPICKRIAVNWHGYIDGLVQERCNSSALAVELCLSCTNPPTWGPWIIVSIMAARASCPTVTNVVDNNYDDYAYISINMFPEVQLHVEMAVISNRFEIFMILFRQIQIWHNCTWMAGSMIKVRRES